MEVSELHMLAALPPSTQRKGGWVGHRASLDTEAKRGSLIIAPARNRTLVILPVA